MDAQSQMTALMGTGTGGTIITILYVLYKALNHRRCRSRCCGHTMDMSMDIENTTPPREHEQPKFEVQNPLTKDEIKGLPVSVVVP
jgi:hypothetical protein